MIFTKREAIKALQDEQMANPENYLGEKALDYLGRQKEIEEAGELVIYTANQLTPDQLAVVGKKARELFGEELFLDCRVDTSLIAGAAVSIGGQYRDYSLKMKLAEAKGKIREIYKDLLWKQRKSGT